MAYEVTCGVAYVYVVRLELLSKLSLSWFDSELDQPLFSLSL